MIPMSLEMKTHCQTCDAPLAPDGAAFICSHECTYCHTCAAGASRCPNCQGELAPRPRRTLRAAGTASGSAPPAIRIVEADLTRPDHQRAVLDLTDAYARDPMGNGRPLDPAVAEALISGLRRHPTTLVFLAFDGDRAVGIVTCFLGFSTFHARPLINIHDLVVLPDQRGRGLGRRLLQAVEERARVLGCCKLTLEVMENNRRALALYTASGFAQATLTAGAGAGLFMSKPL